MPEEHLRPRGYPSQMAYNCKTIKVEPHAMNLTSDCRNHYWKQDSIRIYTWFQNYETKQGSMPLFLMMKLI